MVSYALSIGLGAALAAGLSLAAGRDPLLAGSVAALLGSLVASGVDDLGGWRREGVVVGCGGDAGQDQAHADQHIAEQFRTTATGRR